MTPEYVALPPDITAREALERIRKTGRGKETLAIIYIINEKGKLLEDLRLGSLVLAEPETMIGDIEDRPVGVDPGDDERRGRGRAFERYDRVALPVVDNDGIMLGIVTHDDVLEFAEKLRDARRCRSSAASEALDEPYISRAALDDVPKARRVAGDPVRRPDAHRDGDGGITTGELGGGGGADAVHPADHLQRREQRLAGDQLDHPRDGAARSDAARLVEGASPRDGLRIDARRCCWACSGCCRVQRVARVGWQDYTTHARTWSPSRCRLASSAS